MGAVLSLKGKQLEKQTIASRTKDFELLLNQIAENETIILPAFITEREETSQIKAIKALITTAEENDCLTEKERTTLIALVMLGIIGSFYIFLFLFLFFFIFFFFTLRC